MNWPQLYLFIHLVGVLLWIGPSLGGWLFVERAAQERRRAGARFPTEREVWALRNFSMLIWVEHAGFLLLVLGGVGRIIVLDLPWAEIHWLYAKVMIISVIILPLELVDVYHSHWCLPKALTSWEAGEHSDDVREQLQKYRVFLTRTAVLLAVLLPTLGILAVFKPIW